MTLAQALDGARRLQAQAEAGWPHGFDRARVAAESARYLAVFDAACRRDPRRSREIVAALSEVVEAW